MSDSGGKNAQGLRGFPTPNEIGTAGAYLLFLFGDNPAIAQTILGALEPLVYPDNWYLWGDMSEDDAAEYFRKVVEDAPYNLMPQEIGAPYWDDADAADADDEEQRDVEEWYGEVEIVDDELTFVENLQIWIIAGFVMLAATPLAAITFIPIAQRFTLAFKKHDLGGIIRAFVDGIEVNQADTYAAETSVGEMSIAIPPTMGLLAAEDTPHTLTLVMSADHNPAVTGTPNIQLFRQRLSEADFSPPYLRYDGTTDSVQITPDGGTTWNDAPESDPRHSLALRLPPRGGSDVQCDSAANVVQWIHDFIDALIAAGDTASQILFVVNLLLDFLELLTGFASVIIELITEAAGLIATIGAAALTAAFTSEQYDLLLCIVYCNMDTDGSVSADQLATMEAQTTARLNATAAGVVNIILTLQGETCVTNAGRIGSATADCSGCDCDNCYTWDFHDTDGSGDGWGAAAGFSGYASYDAGFGWRSVAGLGLVLGIMFADTEIVSIQMTGQFSGASGEAISFFWRSGGSTVSHEIQSPVGASGHFDNTDTQDLTIDEIWLNPSGGSFSQQLIESCTIRYRGTNPGWTEGSAC